LLNLIAELLQDALGKDDKMEKDKAAGDKAAKDVKDKKEAKGLL